MPDANQLKRLQNLIWVLIFGGLMTAVLGLSVGRFEPAIGWALVVGGVLVAAVGVVLIFVRARWQADPGK